MAGKSDFFDIRVFVYGTLRQGESNSTLLKDAIFEEVSTIDGFLMYSLGRYPFILPSPFQEKIHIESYFVNETILDQLDQLESFYGDSNPDNLYNRVKVINSKGKEGWIYIFSEIKWPLYRASAMLLKHGNWKNRHLMNNPG